MTKSALKIGIVITLILALSFSVAGAGFRECSCFESINGKLKTEIPTTTYPSAGCCESNSSTPKSDEPCSCKNSSCTLFLEKEKADFIWAQFAGSQIIGSDGPKAEKIPVPNDIGEILIPPLTQAFLYLRIQNLRC
jgi:hypothetical protein